LIWVWDRNLAAGLAMATPGCQHQIVADKPDSPAPINNKPLQADSLRGSWPRQQVLPDANVSGLTQHSIFKEQMQGLRQIEPIALRAFF